MKKRFIIAVMAFVMAFTLIAPFKVQAVNGWQKKGSDWYYYYSDNSYYQNEIEYIKGKYYLFDASGKMRVGWTWFNDNWYYSSSSGALVTGWIELNGKWYYLDPYDFYMYSDGVKTINGKDYFFYSDGVMGTGWIHYIYTSISAYVPMWYYANSSGALQTGWQKINGKWYYFDSYSHIMATDVKIIDGKTYIFAGSGELISQTGWIKVAIEDGPVNWYYVNPDGSYPSGWKKINNVWYYFYPSSNGAAACNTFLEIDGKEYVFGTSCAWLSGSGWYKFDYPWGSRVWLYLRNGSAVTGWVKDGGKWYYIDPNTKFMVDENFMIDGVINIFDSNGVWKGYYRTPGWAKAGGLWYYLDSNGDPITGWITYNGKKYYLNPDNYYMASGWYFKIDGKYYYFLPSGEMATGWITNEYAAAVLYADSSGVLQSGWQTIDGKTYYFEPQGYFMYRGGVYTINGVDHEFDENGVLIY